MALRSALRSALSNPGEVPEIRSRFGIASDSDLTVEDLEVRQARQAAIRDKIFDVAHLIAAEVEPGREVSLALTHLEEALMWAGKGIFR